LAVEEIVHEAVASLVVHVHNLMAVDIDQREIRKKSRMSPRHPHTEARGANPMCKAKITIHQEVIQMRIGLRADHRQAKPEPENRQGSFIGIEKKRGPRSRARNLK
jgi:hypothetical protein